MTRARTDSIEVGQYWLLWDGTVCLILGKVNGDICSVNAVTPRGIFLAEHEVSDEHLKSKIPLEVLRKVVEGYLQASLEVHLRL